MKKKNVKNKKRNKNNGLLIIGIILLFLAGGYLFLNPSILGNLSGAAVSKNGKNLKISGTERYNIIMFANNAVGTPYSASNKVTKSGFLTRFGYDYYDASGLIYRAYYDKAGISFGPENKQTSATSISGIYQATPIKIKDKKKVKNGDLVFLVYKKKPVIVGIYDNGSVIYANSLKKKVMKESLKKYLQTKNKAYLKNGSIIYAKFPEE